MIPNNSISCFEYTFSNKIAILLEDMNNTSLKSTVEMFYLSTRSIFSEKRENNWEEE